MDTTVGGGGGGKGRGGFSGRMGRGWFFLGEWGGVLRRRLVGGGVFGNGVDELTSRSGCGVVGFRFFAGRIFDKPGKRADFPTTPAGWW